MDLWSNRVLQTQVLSDTDAVTIRTYRSDWPPTLGISYAAIADIAASLTPGPGRPAAWMTMYQGGLDAARQRPW